MSGKTVIVVDPNPATQHRVEEAFKDTGFLVMRAGDAGTAQGLAENGTVDLAFLAARLPGGFSGYELARELREQHPAALIYLLSGGFDVYDPERAAAAGVDARVSVPFTARSLRNRVEESLRQLGQGPLPLGAGDGLPGLTPVRVSPDIGLATTIPPQDVQTLAAVPPAPVGDERLATFLPRDYRQAEPVSVDPAVVGPAVERAIMEVLPEVVEGILRNALVTSPAFRDLVDEAVRKAVAELQTGKSGS